MVRYHRAAPRASPAASRCNSGPRFRIPERVDGKRVTAEEATHLIMVRIAELLPERYHGVYADQRNRRRKRIRVESTKSESQR